MSLNSDFADFSLFFVNSLHFYRTPSADLQSVVNFSILRLLNFEAQFFFVSGAFRIGAQHLAAIC